MANRKPPKSANSAFSKNNVANKTVIYEDANLGKIDVVYSVDVANNDFLGIKTLTLISLGRPSSYGPNDSVFKQYILPETDPNYPSLIQQAVLTDQAFLKASIASSAAATDTAAIAADRSDNLDTWNTLPTVTGTAPTKYNPNNLATIPTSTVFPNNRGSSASPASVDIAKPIGIGDGQEFIKSITGGNSILNLKYPVDANYGGRDTVAGGQDFLAIEQFIYKPPQEKQFKTINTTGPNPFVAALTEGLKRNSNLREYIGIVRLPIPNNLSMSNGVDWGDSRANPVEAGAFFTANAAAQGVLSGNISDLFAGSLKGFSELMQAITAGKFGADTSAGTLLSGFLAQYGLGKVGINVDPAQFIARGLGNTINPNLELLFSGPKLRNFSFQFTFAPNDASEADVCRKILRFFKQGMAAKRGTGSQLFLGSPNVFRLRYLTKNNDPIRSLPRYKICALTATNIDYSPGPTYQSYDDLLAGSQTSMMNMTLNFTELTPIFESDYRSFDSASQQDLFGTAGGADVDSLGPIEQINSNDVGF